MSIDTLSQPLKDRIEKALADFTSGRASMHVPPLDTDVDVVLAECSSALEAAEKRIAELESEKETLRPVGVMSEKAFHRLEGSESRFIALWPRPGIYLPRKRPEDGVIVYARTAGISVKGE